MRADIFDLKKSEQALAKSYALRMFGYGTFLGTIVTAPIILLVSFLVSVGSPNSAVLWTAFMVFGFLLYGDAMSSLRKALCLLFVIAAVLTVVSMLYWLPRAAYLAYDHYTHGQAGLPWVLTAVATGLTILLSWTIARGWWGLFRLNNGARGLLTAPFEELLSTNAIKAYCGVPPITAFVQHNKSLVYIYYVLSTLCFYLCFASFFVPYILSSANLQAFLYSRQLGVELSDTSDFQIWAIAIAVAAFLIFAPLGNMFLQMARKRIRFSIEKLTATDPRYPILFLRAFREDQVALRRPRYGLIGRVIALRLPNDSLDELLLNEGTLYGPVVALGNPLDQAPPYGAARGYFADKDWRQAVEDLARNALAIVICLDETDAIWWEVEHIAGADYISKTLFLVPPKMRGQEENAKITATVSNRLGNAELATTLSKGGVVGFFFDQDGSARIGTSPTFSRDAYLTMLRLFFRSKYGTQVHYISQAASDPLRARVLDIAVKGSFGVLALLALLSALAWVASGLVPDMTRAGVLSASAALYASERFWQSAGQTMLHLSAAYGAALMMGISLGIALTRLSSLRLAFGPLVSALATAPLAALAPFVPLLFGVGSTSCMLVGFAAAVFPCMAEMMNQGGFATAHAVIAASRVAIAPAITGVVVGEMFAGSNGLGVLMVDFSTRFMVSEMLGAFAALIVPGIALAILLRMIEALLKAKRPSAAERGVPPLTISPGLA